MLRHPTMRTRVQRWIGTGTLLALVAGGWGLSLRLQAQAVEGQARTQHLVSNARLALELITRDVRLAGYNPTGAPFVGVTVTPMSLHLRADLNGNGTTAEPDEDVYYIYDAAHQHIRRVDRHGEAIIAEHIQTLTVMGLDAAGSPTYVPAQTRAVHVTITAQETSSTPETLAAPLLPPYTIRTQIALRNPAGQSAPVRSAERTL